jgi:hypothetical protein
MRGLEGGQLGCANDAVRGSVELPDHSKDRRVDEKLVSTCVPGRLRARLESTTPPAQDVSTPLITGKTLGRGNGRCRQLVGSAFLIRAFAPTFVLSQHRK